MTDARSSIRVGSYVNGSLSRAQLLKAVVAAGLTATAFPSVASAAGSGSFETESFPYFPQVTSGRYTTESVDAIVSNILTWNYLEATATTILVTDPTIQKLIGQSPFTLNFLQSFLAGIQAQIEFWSSIVPAAKPETTTFTIDPALLSSPAAALAVYDLASGTRVAMMITAVREFAELGQPTLARYAAQTLAMYAEDHGTVRALEVQAGAPGPVIRKAFETEVFLYTREAVDVLHGLGLIGGTGITLHYPGRDAVLAAAAANGRGVTQLQPNSVTTPFTFAGPESVLDPRG